MADGGLPADGPAQVGPVRLPAGRRITGQGRPVVWATDEPVPGAGLAWSALAGVHPQTGLVPILLSGLQGQPSRPWDDGEFLPPAGHHRARPHGRGGRARVRLGGLHAR